jgi:large subunit ribosomal protein L14e
VNESESSPRIGQFVRVLQGREHGQIAIIIKILDERFVLIADGDKRKFDCPKKKNVNHLDIFEKVSPEVQNSVKETGRVTNGKLRFAISKFVNEHVTDLEKGE